MSDTIVPQSAPKIHTEQPIDVFVALQSIMWRGGEYGYYWTPDGPEYVDDNGVIQRRKITAWRRPAKQPRPPGAWCELNQYFGVHPTNQAGESWQRASKTPTRKKKDGTTESVPVVAAFNGFFADLDAKDYVTDEEWQPFYVAPNLDGLSKPKAQGALIEAQKNAKENACQADLEKYKRRAYEHLINAPLRASAAWDTGGGYQAIWLLADTIAVTDNNRAELRHYQKEWAVRLGSDQGATDLERVLRIPGSENHKPKRRRPDGTYPEVVFLWAELDRRYTYADFTALLPAVAQPTPNAPRRVYVPPGAALDLGELGEVPFIPKNLHPAIDYYNARTDLHELLLDYGYEDDPSGNGRMRRPGGSSLSVQLHNDNTSSHYSSNDPLYSERRITPAHVTAVYEGYADRHALIEALTGYARHELPEFDNGQKWRLLRWAQSKAARDLLRDAYNIRRPDGYLRTLEALIIMAGERESWCFVPGVFNAGLTCNASHTSVGNHLKWMNGTLWQVWPTEKGLAVDLCVLHWLVDRFPCDEAYANVARDGIDTLQQPCNVSVGLNTATFLHTQVQHDTLANDEFVPVAYPHAMSRRMETTVLLPSLGHAGRVAMSYIVEMPGITRAEIAEQSGVSRRSLERTLQLMERMHLVDVTEDVEGAKQYTLAEDAEERICALLPHMTCYKMGTRRAEQAEQSRAKWLFKQLQAEQDEPKRAVIKAKMKTCDEKQALLKAELLAAGIKPAKGWRPPPQITPDRGIVTPDRDQAAQLLEAAAAKQLQTKVEATAGDIWRRREYAKSKAAIEENWPVFYPWLMANYGQRFTTMSETDIQGAWKVYEVVSAAACNLNSEVVSAAVCNLNFEGAAAGL